MKIELFFNIEEEDQSPLYNYQLQQAIKRFVVTNEANPLI
jgi:hypothetical protein